jgi:hypothetical protein
MDRPTRSRHSRFVAFAALAVALVGCRTISVPPPDHPPAVTITASPGIYPTFRTSIVDYVVRCDATHPVTVNVNAPTGTAVSVNGTAFATGTFTRTVTRDVGRRFRLVVRTSTATTEHRVRCLPRDFPQFTSRQYGDTQSEFYVTAPNNFNDDISYVAVFDTNGVPVWWAKGVRSIYAFPAGNGIGWESNGRFEEHRLDGSLVKTYAPVGQPMDNHDVVTLANGNHIVATATPKSGVNLSSWGGPAGATITDHIFQEVTPGGTVVWSWRVSDHIGVNETGREWRAAELANPGGGSGIYDPYHWNSVEWNDGGIVVSFRHLDAVYKIRRSTGAIEWKVGGTRRAESLTVVGDPVFDAGGTFGGQHDARILSDGTLTLYDNGTHANRPARGVHYRLDLARRTATLLDVVGDPSEPAILCCGSYRQLVFGNVVFGWGHNQDSGPDVAEYTSTGQRRFTLTFTDPATFVYRAIPILPDVFTRADFVAGMDAQYAN